MMGPSKFRSTRGVAVTLLERPFTASSASPGLQFGQVHDAARGRRTKLVSVSLNRARRRRIRRRPPQQLLLVGLAMAMPGLPRVAGEVVVVGLGRAGRREGGAGSERQHRTRGLRVDEGKGLGQSCRRRHSTARSPTQTSPAARAGPVMFDVRARRLRYPRPVVGTIAFFDLDGTLLRHESGVICAIPSARRGLPRTGDLRGAGRDVPAEQGRARATRNDAMRVGVCC